MIIVTWLALSVLIGVLAQGKSRSFVGWFVLSLCFSPLIGLIALLVAGEAK